MTASTASELAAARPRFGYRRLTILLKREGVSVWHGRVQRIVKCFEQIGRGFFNAKNVGRRGQHQRRGVKLFFGIFFQPDLKMKPLGRNIFQVLFEPGDLLPTRPNLAF